MRERASPGKRRRTGKKIGVAVADCLRRFSNRSRTADLHQDNDSRGYRYRRNGMQDNAERAVIGIGFQRVDMNHLDHRYERQQGQAQHGHNDHAARRGKLASAPDWSESVQKTVPYSFQNTRNSMQGARLKLRKQADRVRRTRTQPTRWTVVRLKCEVLTVRS